MTASRDVVREIEGILAGAAARGERSLGEHDSLRVLAAWGIPVVRFRYAPGLPEAAALAGPADFPVVVKGIVPSVAHKTEKGLVHPWVRSAAGLDAVLRALPGGCAGVLVEEQVAGIRELVVGLVRDPSMGPAVLVAFGGVHSELVGDGVFLPAPVAPSAVPAALARLRCSRMLGSYRGEAPARMDELAALVEKVGTLAEAFPAVRELDVNPVILRRDGSPVAASALVII